jgi:DNA-binding XRE family transcriptional regulator
VVYARAGYLPQGYPPEERENSVTLKEWLAKNGITQDQFAEEWGIGQSTVSRVCMGGNCKPSVAIVIHTATSGAVTPNDIYLSQAA